MADTKSRSGKPPKYTSREQIEELIQNYFDDCKGKLLETEAGPVYDKYGHPVLLGVHPPTVTGLAYALGFKSRQSLLDYRAKKEFQDTIDRAKLYIEMYTEERLFDKDGANGAKFSLQNNFRGWNDAAKEIAAAVPAVNIICDIPRPEETHADTE
jgi:hypothetical protein